MDNLCLVQRSEIWQFDPFQVLNFMAGFKIVAVCNLQTYPGPPTRFAQCARTRNLMDLGPTPSACTW